MTVVLALLVVLVVLLWPSRRGLACRTVTYEALASRASGRTGDRTGGRVGTATVDEVADALVLIALALRAGLDLTQALEAVAVSARGPVATDLSAVVAAVRWGRPVDEAWSYAGAVWRPAALAWSVADTTGAAPAALVAEAGVRLREEQERDRERRAARAGVLLVLPLGLGFLPAFACTAVLPVVIALAVGVLDSSG
ncbi:type II secretion system F family protein [Pedococcus sp. KACC 23699]|uniref:Type II secretion system F family protein n=1 Tax=Pedococcus sp. KACC 23699 TaxID=3149228 RepID=A0AAU7JNM9_9MICO